MTDPLRLTSLDWRRAFPRGACERGREYARDGRVDELQSLDPQGGRWSARVAGGHAERYRTMVQVLPATGDGVPKVLSSCSCPIGSLCKHAAAVLHRIELEQMGEDAIGAPAQQLRPRALPRRAAAPDDWERWLDRLAPPAPPAAPDARADFGLLLRAAEHGDPPQLLAAMVAFAQGKQGQRINPRSVAVVNGQPTLAPAGGWPEEDLFALLLLLENQHERIGTVSYAALRGRIQERALEHLLWRYPVCFERANRPLAPAPPRRLALQWEDLPDGSQRLACRPADGAPVQLLRLHGLWYVDEASARIGRIEADGTRLLDAARSAPTLDPDQVTQVRARLQRAAAPLPIPLPAERAPPRQLVTAPRPVLRLRRFGAPRSAFGAGRQAESVGVAALAFDYGALRLDAGGLEHERRLHRGEMLDVVRDRGAEARAAARLRELGMTPPQALPWPFRHAYDALHAQDWLLAPGKAHTPEPPEAWLETLRTLAADGWRLEYAEGFPRPLREVESGEWEAELSEQGNGWFELSLGIELEGQRFDLLPILRQLLADPAFPLRPTRGEAADARWRIALDQERAVSLPLERLRALLAPLLDWLQQDGALRLHRSQGEALGALASHVHWRGDARLHERLIALRAQATPVTEPPGFLARLRPYQCEGLGWLEFLAEAGLGGVLADDMGLGKTVQVLAHVLARKQHAGGAFRVLVVAPTSLMGNWRDEAARFAPELKVLLLHGPDRADRYDEIAAHDLILTTYPLLPRDRERLLQHAFDLLVLDEAQAIKNARSQAAQVVRELRASRRLAMTGTPLENHLGELWAQFDAVEPGLLGSERDFTRFYRTPIEKHGDRDRQQRLQRRIGALLLRRRKDEVLQDLPPKTEIVRMLELEGAQRELYETLRLAQHERVREAIAERGLAQSGIVVLDALLKLRQACCDPRLVKLPAARRVTGSAKLEALQQLLRTLLDEGRRVLLFSQFTAMLDLIEPALREQDIDFLRLDGDTPGAARAGLVRRFQAGETGLFLISLKAGGVGLNLTAADTVIHYDPWWNPAVERQATDRAHRIGQNKAVFVYKLICSGTVEEKILALQSRKAELAQAVLEGGRSTQLRFDEADLSELFAPLQ